jgi:hypothetical protein
LDSAKLKISTKKKGNICIFLAMDKTNARVDVCANVGSKLCIPNLQIKIEIKMKYGQKYG